MRAKSCRFETVASHTLVVLPPRYDVPKAAPEPLRLVQRFVNTLDAEHGREWLGNAEALERWLRDAGFADVVAQETDVWRAHELREALRVLLAANNEARLDPHAAAAVNRAARAGSVVVELDETGSVDVRARASGVEGALGSIVAVAFEAMRDGTWKRLKACRNCRWSFFDYSKNRSASWCSMSICGNRLKTRRYRTRRGLEGA